MMDLSIVGEVMEKYWKNKVVDFILGKRLCNKHMREFIKDDKLEDNNIKVVQILGICEKCKKAGIVYYLNYPNRKGVKK